VSAIAVTTLDGRPVAVIGGSLGDGVIRVWDLAGGTQRHQLASHTIGVNVIAIGGRDGWPIAVAGGNYDSVVGVWDLARGTQLSQLPGHTDGVDAIAIGALDDHLIAVVGTGYDDGTVRVWDPVEGRQLRTISIGRSIRVVTIDPRQTVVLGTLTGLVALRLHW
jgi:WD40 repeat protein